MASKKPNLKHEAFIREYMLSKNASEAYRKAGYKGKNADVLGAQLLVNPSIAARVAEETQKVEQLAKEKYNITQERILEELEAIAFGNLSSVASWDRELGLVIHSSADLSERDAKFIESIQETKNSYGRGDDKTEITTLQIKTMAGYKVPALKLLGQHIGMWTKGPKDGSGDNRRDTKAVLSRVSSLLRKRRNG
jgi:phage terminase small subunit